MKFELKTENENYSKSFSNIFRNIFFLSLIIIFCDVALKLGIISRNHKIEYNCRLLSFEIVPNFREILQRIIISEREKIILNERKNEFE